MNRRNCKVKTSSRGKSLKKKQSVDDPKIYKHPEIKISFVLFIISEGKIEENGEIVI